MTATQEYTCFEQGPIRPPSEAASLLLRLTRNCPWNRCSFCSIYKGRKFSLRPLEHVLRDIDAVHQAVSVILEETGRNGQPDSVRIHELAAQYFDQNREVYYTAVQWLARGGGSVFLQDANSLIMPHTDLIAVLRRVKECFPWVTRITSYARSHTIRRMSDGQLAVLAGAGLNRIHIGMESGSDRVLERIDKGVTRQDHITAGRRVKQAGIELSEYIMPGLGGAALSEEHALETADALNRIDADFIRLRTLAVVPGTPLHEQLVTGEFDRCTDRQMVAEIRAFIAHLDGITSVVKSDHMRNLLQEVEGTLPDDKDFMLAVLDRFLALPPEEQAVFQLGRRSGFFEELDDLESPPRLDRVLDLYRRWGVTPANVDAVIENNLQVIL